jgi:acyl carrier protein
MQRLDDLITEILECDIDSFSNSTPFKEIEGWDSLKHLGLVVGIETIFQIQLSAEDIQKMTSLEDAHRLLKERGINE